MKRLLTKIQTEAFPVFNDATADQQNDLMRGFSDWDYFTVAETI